jgi:metallophosphoesterase (TIGR00282 family)
VWRQREVYSFLSSSDRIVRPGNYPQGSPGRALTVRQVGDEEVAIVNVMGSLYMDVGVSPFRIVDALIDEAMTLAPTIVVDMHAEATSEKVAMGQYLDGRVTAVVGTHTHVQTADEQVLPRGTAYITDVGMTGPVHSVIGVRSDIILRKFTTELPVPFEVADGDVRIDAVVIEAEGGRARSITRFEEIV